MPYSMQLTEQIPNDPPQMGAKSTTTSTHTSTPPGMYPCRFPYPSWWTRVVNFMWWTHGGATVSTSDLQTLVTEPIDWEQRIACMVESALAWALATASGVPARESGPPSSDNNKQPAPLALQPGPGVPLTDDATHTDTLALLARQPGPSVQLIDAHPVQHTSTRPAQDSAIGVLPRDEGAVAASGGCSLLPVAGSPRLGGPDVATGLRAIVDSYERLIDNRHDRRTVTLGRSQAPTSTITRPYLINQLLTHP